MFKHNWAKGLGISFSLIIIAVVVMALIFLVRYDGLCHNGGIFFGGSSRCSFIQYVGQLPKALLFTIAIYGYVYFKWVIMILAAPVIIGGILDLVKKSRNKISDTNQTPTI